MEGHPMPLDEADAILAFAAEHGLNLSEWQERITRTAYGTDAPIAVHGWPGSIGVPSPRPARLRGRGLLPFRARRMR